jgi:hypothetical protein
MESYTLTMLALIRGQRAMDLAQLAESIRRNRDLRSIVIETACEEFGWPRLSVEEAVVLLGGKRLYALLSRADQRGRSVSHARRTIHGNSIAPAANPGQLEMFQGEPK